MFRPIRTLFLILIAFVAGLLFERSQTAEKCRALGGAYSVGLCRETTQ